MHTADLDVSSVAKAAWEAVQRAWPPIGAYIAFAAVTDGFVTLLKLFLPRILTLPVEFAATVAQMYVGFGLSLVALRVLRGEGEGLRPADLLVDRALFLRMLPVVLVVGLAVGFGLFMLVVPGVFLWLLWSQSLWLVLDGKAERLESLRQSVFLVDGAKTRMLLVLLVFALGVALAAIPVTIINFIVGKWLGAGVFWLWSMSAAVYFVFLSAVMYERLIQWKPVLPGDGAAEG